LGIKPSLKDWAFGDVKVLKGRGRLWDKGKGWNKSWKGWIAGKHTTRKEYGK